MTALRKKLDEDVKFADTCGYRITEPISYDSLCLCFRKLAETEALARITEDLTAKTKELDMVDSEKIDLDSCKLESYDSPRPAFQIDWNVQFRLLFSTHNRAGYSVYQVSKQLIVLFLV